MINLTSTAWNKLLEFESRDLIERYIKEKHDRKASARQVAEISSNFIQGREYFKNAANAAITVKPVLQYYGITALCRGLILASSPKLSEAAMKPSHGLDTVGWREKLANRDFKNLTIEIKKGTFFELLEATSNRAYFRHNTSKIDWYVDYQLPPQHLKFTFFELLQTLPDFEKEFEIWSQTKLDAIVLSSFQSSEGSFEYVVSPSRNNPGAIKSVFPELIVGSYTINESKSQIIIKTDKKYVPHFSQKFIFPLAAGLRQITLTQPIKHVVHLNPLTQFYAISFFLGMLARYFPSVWISLSRTEKGDAIYPLLIKIMEVIDNYFPEMISDQLDGPYSFPPSHRD